MQIEINIYNMPQYLLSICPGGKFWHAACVMNAIDPADFLQRDLGNFRSVM